MKWNELLHGVSKVTPNYNFSGSSHKPNKLDVKYNPRTLMITFTAEMQSSKSRNVYSLTVQFLRVQKEDGLTDDEILQGYLPKPSLAKHDVKVRCTCPTYRFRFDKANRLERATVGRFGSYHNITNRAPNNPNDIPGLCYHLIEFVDYLQSQGFIH